MAVCALAERGSKGSAFLRKMMFSSKLAANGSSVRKTESTRNTMIVGKSSVLFPVRLASCTLRLTAMACLCLVVSLAAGCGGPSGPQGKVHGKVTYQGKPISTGAMVSFLSDSGAAASGMVSADGAYQVRSMNGDTIPAGKYKVLITPPSGPQMTPEEAMNASMAKKDKDQGPAADPTIPAQYRSILQTPASYEIKAGDNEINIELQDK
jgi:hypothetical protein